eukprot:COSAG06_NODE_14398_length_1160_cov_1.218662_1_plen_88_part_00
MLPEKGRRHNRLDKWGGAPPEGALNGRGEGVAGKGPRAPPADGRAPPPAPAPRPPPRDPPAGAPAPFPPAAAAATPVAAAAAAEESS